MTNVDAPTGRFTYLPSPVALPGCCMICRNDKGPFVDTQVFFPGHGAVVVCSTCVVAMGDVLDVGPSVASLEARRAIFKSGYDKGRAKAIKSVHEAISQSLSDLGINYDDFGIDSVDSTTDSVVDAEPDVKPDPEELLEDPKGDAGNIPEPEQSNLEDDGDSGEPGPDDVSGDSGDGDSDSGPRLPDFAL